MAGLASLLRARTGAKKPVQKRIKVPTGDTRAARRKRAKLVERYGEDILHQPPPSPQQPDSGDEAPTTATAPTGSGTEVYRQLVQLVNPQVDVSDSESDEDSDLSLDADLEIPQGSDLDLDDCSVSDAAQSGDGVGALEPGVEGDSLDEGQEGGENGTDLEPAEFHEDSMQDEGGFDEDEDEEDEGFILLDREDEHTGGPPRDSVQDRLNVDLSADRAAALLSHEGRELKHVVSPALASAVDSAWPSSRLLATADWQAPSWAAADQRASSAGKHRKAPQAPGFPRSLLEYPGIKERLVRRWQQMTSSAPGEELAVCPRLAALFGLLQTGADVLHTARPYPTSPDPESPDPELDVILLHALQTCYSQLDTIRSNNERLQKRGDSCDTAGIPRDQTFARPKVLFLLPMRNAAYKLVMRLAKLGVVEGKGGMPGKARFIREYGPDASPEELRAAAASAAAKGRPPEQAALFMGNTDDHFRLCIQLGRASMKLFVDLADADIVVSSPLHLATALSQGGPEAADAFSSVQLVILDRADVVLMQNWSHVVTSFEGLNRVPVSQLGADILRLRLAYADGRAACYRQTVVMSSFLTPELLALSRRYAASHAGALRLATCSAQGVLPRVVPQLRQVFERLTASSPTDEPEARFARFRDVIWPKIREGGRSGGQLVYVPSYYDFVRVRNFLRAEQASLLALSEYTDPADVTRARQYFQDGRRNVLLLTERAQFYHRPKLRGARDAHFYQLPNSAQFYEEILNQIEESPAGGLPTVNVLFSKLDVLRLEYVVGAARARRMLKPKSNSTFLFC